MDVEHGYGMTSEYDEELDLDSILADFRDTTVGADAVSPYDPDGDGEYEYGTELEADGEEELSYEEFARRRELQELENSDTELSYEDFVRMQELEEQQAQAQREKAGDGDVKVYTPPKSRRQKMAEEAVSFMSSLPEKDFDAPAVPEEDYEDEAEQRRLSWEEEVREFYGEPKQDKGKDIDFDPRFNLSGKRDNRAYVFRGQELDLSAEEGYVPARSENTLSHWAGDEGLPGTVEEKPKEKKRWGRRKKKNAGFDREAVPPPEEQDDFDELFHQSYDAPNRRPIDEGYDFAAPERIGGISVEDTFPSFKEFYLGELMGLAYKLRFSGLFSSPAAYLKDDEPAKEVEPLAASTYYQSYLGGMKLRLRIGAVLLVLMAWLGLGLPIFGALNDLRVSAGMCLAMQLTLMLLNLDVVTGAFLNIFRRRFGADTLAFIACILTSVDALAVLLNAVDLHRPFVIISSLALYGVMLSAYYSAKGLRKSLRVSGIAQKRYSLTAERGTKNSYDTLLKSDRSHAGFVRRSEEMPPDESLYIKLSPIILILAMLLSVVVCLVRKSWSDFLYVSTAILSMGVPVSALLCFALPFCVGSFHIFKQGAAISGWSGVCDLGKSERLIITDRDLFPKSCVGIDGVVLFTKLSRERCISYAATMAYAGQICTLPSFLELMEKCNANTAKKGKYSGESCQLKPLENFEILSGGGFKGIIEGHVVLLGGLELMKLMNVKLAHRFVSDRSVLLAIDGMLVSVFNIKYEADAKVRKAITDLMRSNTHPIFAVRDFNVTPRLLRELFDLPTDGYDFPPYSQRFRMTDAESVTQSPISAVICRDGLLPLVRTAETGRNIYSVTRINLLISAISAAMGMLLVFLKLLVAGSIPMGFMLAFSLLFALPVFVLSILIRL